MDRKNYDKAFKIFVGIALGVSLILNVSLVSKVNDMAFQVNNITDNQHVVMSNTSNQTGEIQHMLQEMQEEQRWISRINIDNNWSKLEDGQGEARFEWQVKELEEGSDVVFHYAFGDDDDYTAIPAEEIQQGMFQASVPFEVDVEPQWRVNVMNHNNRYMEEMNQSQVEEEMEESSLSYYVTVSKDDLVRSSDVQREYLGYLGTEKYGFIHVDVNLREDKVDLFVDHSPVDHQHLTNMVDEVTLLQYEGETLIGEEQFEAEEQQDSDMYMRFFHLDQVEQFDDMRFVLRIVYGDGKTFEQEVYDEN